LKMKKLKSKRLKNTLKINNIINITRNIVTIKNITKEIIV